MLFHSCVSSVQGDDVVFILARACRNASRGDNGDVATPSQVVCVSLEAREHSLSCRFGSEAFLYAAKRFITVRSVVCVYHTATVEFSV